MKHTRKISSRMRDKQINTNDENINYATNLKICVSKVDTEFTHVFNVCELKTLRILTIVLEDYPVRLKTLARMLGVEYDRAKKIVASLVKLGLLRKLPGKAYGPGPVLAIVLARWCELVGGADTDSGDDRE